MDEGLPAGIVTILCTDVEGSTALRNRRRDDAAQVQLQGFTAHWRLHEVLWHPMPAPAGTGLW